MKTVALIVNPKGTKPIPPESVTAIGKADTPTIPFPCNPSLIQGTHAPHRELLTKYFHLISPPLHVIDGLIERRPNKIVSFPNSAPLRITVNMLSLGIVENIIPFAYLFTAIPTPTGKLCSSPVGIAPIAKTLNTVPAFVVITPHTFTS